MKKLARIVLPAAAVAAVALLTTDPAQAAEAGRALVGGRAYFGRA